ncbi:ATP-binding protein [Candidatus Latescibacterota bacterium]
MRDLSLHIIDIAENSIRAGADLIEIILAEDEKNDRLTVEVIDNGKGMNPEILKKASDPFYSGKDGKRIGLGLSMLAQAAREADGEMEISSTPGQGTKVKAVFRSSHPDLKPIGEMAATVQALVVGNSEIDFVFEYRRGLEITRIDTREIK